MRHFKVNLRQKPHSPFPIPHSPFPIPRFSNILLRCYVPSTFKPPGKATADTAWLRLAGSLNALKSKITCGLLPMTAKAKCVPVSVTWKELIRSWVKVSTFLKLSWPMSLEPSRIIPMSALDLQTNGRNILALWYTDKNSEAAYFVGRDSNHLFLIIIF